MENLTVRNTLTTSIVEIIDQYLAQLDVKPKSRDTYKKSLKQFTNFIETRNGVDPLTRTDILAYKSFLQEHYSACTISTYMTAVKGLFVYLEAEKITPNIAAGIKGAKAQRGFKKDALTVEQAKIFLGSIDTESLEGKRNFALVNLLLRTGLRTIEIERSNIADIRQEGGTALLYIQGKGRDEKDAFVVLTESTHRPIREYLKARGATDPSEPLFTSHSDRNNGGRLTTRSLSRIVKESLISAGLESDRLTAHSLRHTAVTFSLLGGATIQETQGMARHSNINTTMIYAHNINRVKQAPERKIDALLL